MMVMGTIGFGMLAFLANPPGITHGGALALPSFLYAAGRGFAQLWQRAAPVLPAILYLGVLSSVVAFFLVNFNLSRLRASQSSVYSNLSTAVSVAAGVFLRGERFGPLQATGAVLILPGVWGANTFNKE